MGYAIEIEHVSKHYMLGKKKHDNIRDSLSQLFKKSTSQYREFWALRDVSFNVNQGEVIGLIGKNGAGKSTLLKIISQITPLTSGRIVLNGRVASLLEVGTGFHAELTGLQNIFLNGTILGMKRAEIKSKLDEIIDFAGVSNFIDTPVKHYSSGMYVRLAFAVAAHLEPEILIVDEVLAVGDSEFQKKCIGKMQDVSKNHGRTILFVSHNMTSLKQLCNKGILLQDGAVTFQGDIGSAISLYSRGDEKLSKDERINNPNAHVGTGELIVTSIVATDKSDDVVLHTGDTIDFKFNYEIKDENYDFTSCHIGVLVYDKNQNLVFTHSNRFVGLVFKDSDFKDHKEICFRIKDFPLVAGSYSLTYNIVDQNKYLDSMENAIEFEVENGLAYNYQQVADGGIIAINAFWQIR